MLKIYHNPRCAKSREGLKYLTDRNLKFEMVQYLENPLHEEDLKRILMKLNLKPAQVIRTQEELYRKELKGRTFTDEEWISIILENPRLLQRPIVEGKYRAVVAIPAKMIEGLVKEIK
jgi:arsenate reductase (glutaredoxin)